MTIPAGTDECNAMSIDIILQLSTLMEPADTTAQMMQYQRLEFG